MARLVSAEAAVVVAFLLYRHQYYYVIERQHKEAAGVAEVEEGEWNF